MNLSLNANTVNKALVTANAADVKDQYSEFEAEVKARATALGYAIF
ncbi:hypothetical protein [Candidatus Clostridium radicumherbarum]|uniref:Uncharacterized protein n=1 Tax=Candidatus Clostridium radicumherbarum TaxID=3381662 RepID=A0ABW8TNH0_9CLOT